MRFPGYGKTAHRAAAISFGAVPEPKKETDSVSGLSSAKHAPAEHQRFCFLARSGAAWDESRAQPARVVRGRTGNLSGWTAGGAG